ncbi:hypothetical protein FRC17_000976, partial [Serendipita sp. 399]
MSALPNEILLNIFEQIQWDEDAPNPAGRLALVCKRFYNLFWRHSFESMHCVGITSIRRFAICLQNPGDSGSKLKAEYVRRAHLRGKVINAVTLSASKDLITSTVKRLTLLTSITFDNIAINCELIIYLGKLPNLKSLTYDVPYPNDVLTANSKVYGHFHDYALTQNPTLAPSGLERISIKFNATDTGFLAFTLLYHIVKTSAETLQALRIDMNDCCSFAPAYVLFNLTLPCLTTLHIRYIQFDWDVFNTFYTEKAKNLTNVDILYRGEQVTLPGQEVTTVTNFRPDDLPRIPQYDVPLPDSWLIESFTMTLEIDEKKQVSAREVSLIETDFAVLIQVAKYHKFIRVVNIWDSQLIIEDELDCMLTAFMGGVRELKNMETLRFNTDLVAIDEVTGICNLPPTFCDADGYNEWSKCECDACAQGVYTQGGKNDLRLQWEEHEGWKYQQQIYPLCKYFKKLTHIEWWLCDNISLREGRPVPFWQFTIERIGPDRDIDKIRRRLMNYQGPNSLQATAPWAMNRGMRNCKEPIHACPASVLGLRFFMAFRSPPSSNPVSPIIGPSYSISNARVPPFNLQTEGSTSALQQQPPAPPLTLVIPTICTQRKITRRALEAVSPRTGKPYPNRLKGHKPTQSATIDVVPPASAEENWVSPLGKFDIEQDSTELEGYQMYAVEKWVVDRSRFMKVVLVFTGDPKDVISVTIITPSSKLSNEEAQLEYDNACRVLRRDGARPRQTVLGVILTTNLASFRSDLNIVRIPGGDYLSEKDKLYVNINLLRLGCSGRTALTLEAPSESIQERFKQLFSIPAIAVQRLTFEGVVLSFVRLVQSALMIYDLLDMSDERDGLLGDATVDSVQRWTLEIGEKLRELRLEPAERILDPPVVASILSVVAAVRSKLLVLLPAAANVPKDPFQHPRAFTEALALVSPAHLTRPGPTGNPQAFLTASLINHINGQYKRKTTESKPSLIALGEKTLATLRPSESLTFPSSIVGSTRMAPESVVRETSDLIAFTKSQSVISKDPIESLQFVWTGKMGPGLLHAKHAQEMEERIRAEERDLENKSDARSGDDDERVIGKGISALRQEISARLPSLPGLQ